jgi:hypothetical protein
MTRFIKEISVVALQKRKEKERKRMRKRDIYSSQLRQAGLKDTRDIYHILPFWRPQEFVQMIIIYMRYTARHILS